MDSETLRVFVKVAELGNLSQAGQHLGMSRSRVSRQIQGLESELGGRLFHRSTRVVRLTADGEALLPRARRMVREADEVNAMFRSGPRLRGRVRVDMPVNLARRFVLPKLPVLLKRHPELRVFVSTTDRFVDPIREGFDCVMRVGESADSDLVQRRLGALEMVNCASREYLEERGVPQTLEDLDEHLLIHYAPSDSIGPPELEYVVDQAVRTRPMASMVTVNSGDAYQATCLAGLGIIQVPRIGVQEHLTTGRLVALMPDLRCAPMPVVLLQPHGRRPPPRVRATMQWIEDALAPHLA